MGAGSPAGGFVKNTALEYAPDPICRLCGNAQTGSQTVAIVAEFQEYTMNQSKGSKLSLRNRTVGMAAVFAAASNAPLALAIMAVELVGMNVAPHVLLVSVLAYLFIGRRSIYPAQRIVVAGSPITIRDLGQSRKCPRCARDRQVGCARSCENSSPGAAMKRWRC